MTGTKMITVGFLLTFLGLGLLAILAIPNASFALANAFTDSPVTQAGQAFSVLDPSYMATAQTFERIGEIVALIFLLAGLAFAGTGLFRKA